MVVQSPFTGQQRAGTVRLGQAGQTLRPGCGGGVPPSARGGRPPRSRTVALSAPEQSCGRLGAAVQPLQPLRALQTLQTLQPPATSWEAPPSATPFRCAWHPGCPWWCRKALGPACSSRSWAEERAAGAAARRTAGHSTIRGGLKKSGRPSGDVLIRVVRWSEACGGRGACSTSSEGLPSRQGVSTVLAGRACTRRYL